MRFWGSAPLLPPPAGPAASSAVVSALYVVHEVDDCGGGHSLQTCSGTQLEERGGRSKDAAAASGTETACARSPCWVEPGPESLEPPETETPAARSSPRPAAAACSPPAESAQSPSAACRSAACTRLQTGQFLLNPSTPTPPPALRSCYHHRHHRRIKRFPPNPIISVPVVTFDLQPL